jgi:cytoskeletal protein CcmA (bactofilin family)
MNDVDQKPTTPARSLEEVPPAPTTTAPRRSTEPSRANRSVGARMTVGPGIKLKGEVSDCDTLVVEGTVEATLKSEVLEVADGGTYTGTATVTDAEIHGRFEGELTVTGVLQIRSTGHVTGTIKYGRIEVESGGEIAGTVTREESGAPTATSPENRPLTAPRQVSQNASQAS